MSRIWIYQAERKLKPDERDLVENSMKAFVGQWKAHGVPLKAEFELKHDLFLILKVDEGHHEATGCSIDDSVHQVKELEKRLNVKLFNRQRVAYLSNGEVLDCSMADFKKLAGAGEVNEETLVFNNSISQAQEFSDSWLVPAGKSWHKMLLQ